MPKSPNKQQPIVGDQPRQGTEERDRVSATVKKQLCGKCTGQWLNEFAFLLGLDKAFLPGDTAQDKPILPQLCLNLSQLSFTLWEKGIVTFTD